MTQNLQITVGFSTGRSWTSKLIKWVTKSYISHAWLAFHDSSLGMRLVLGASDRGVVLEPWWKFEDGNWIAAEFAPSSFPLEDSLKWFIREHGNARYDYGAAGATGIRSMFSWLWKRCGKWFRKKLADPTKFMCSELLIRILGHARYRLTTNMDPETTNAKLLMVAYFSSPNEMKLLSAKPEILSKYGVQPQ